MVIKRYIGKELTMGEKLIEDIEKHCMSLIKNKLTIASCCSIKSVLPNMHILAHEFLAVY